MRAIVLLVSLAVSALHVAPVAADPGSASRLEGIRFVKGDASWDEIFAWAKAKHLLEQQRRQLMAPILRAREASLKNLARPLGNPFPWTLQVAGDRARLTRGPSVFVVQLGAEGRYAQLTPAKRRALVVAMAFKKQMIARTKQPKPLVLTEAKGAGTKTLFGMTCSAYDVSGNGRGRVWIHKPAGPLGAFATAAAEDLGRLDGSLLLAAARAGGIPVLAKVRDVKGPSLSGNATGGKLIQAVWRTGRDRLPDVSVPKGYAVQQIPPK